MKAFTRTFVLVPTGTGFNIINDMLSITNPGERMLEVSILNQVMNPTCTVLNNIKFLKTKN